MTLSRTAHVHFTPDSDHESGFPQKVMSALPPKADACGAVGNVGYGPLADACWCAQPTRPSRPGNTKHVRSTVV